MKDNKNHPMIWIVCILGYATGDLFVNCTVCGDTAKAHFLPVARFCSNDSVSGAPILMDGFYADTFDDITTCKCIVELSQKYATFTYQDAYDLSTIYNSSNCGSTVSFSHLKWNQTSISCTMNGTIPLPYGYLDMYLTRNTTNGNRSYCFKINTDAGYKLTVSCVEPIRNTTYSKHQPTSTTHLIPEKVASESDALSSRLECLPS